MTTIERIARILEPQAWRAIGVCDTLAYSSRRTSSLRKAKRVLEALREPTDAMAVAGDESDYICDEGIRMSAMSIDPKIVFRAMIDEALKAVA